MALGPHFNLEGTISEIVFFDNEHINFGRFRSRNLFFKRGDIGRRNTPGLPMPALNQDTTPHGLAQRCVHGEARKPRCPGTLRKALGVRYGVKPLFALGQVVAAPGALAALEKAGSSRGIFFPVMPVVIGDRFRPRRVEQTTLGL
jgi:hypothetical protein